MTQDICLEPPRTQLEASERYLNFLTAHFIGLSKFKTSVEVSHENIRTSVMVRRKLKVFVKEYEED